MARPAVSLASMACQDRDYNVIEVAFPNMRAVLAEKKVDVVSVGTPQFAWDPEMEKIAQTLFTQRDALGKTEVVIWVARQGFLEKNRAAMIDFLQDMLRDGLTCSIRLITPTLSRSSPTLARYRPTSSTTGCSLSAISTVPWICVPT